MGWGSLSGCDQGSMRTSRMVAFDYLGEAICCECSLRLSRSASHECSSAVPSHHLPKIFLPQHFLPSIFCQADRATAHSPVTAVGRGG
jgi:hypothetical protein